MAHLVMLWAKMRDSLWFVPSLLTLAGGALATLIVELEKKGVIDVGHPDHWLFGGGAEGARGVLSAIAGGLITVTGVVFSVTIVALQLASSQFTPRVLRNFTADRVNQAVLGVFISTFTYTLLVLRTVRSSNEGEEAFIPRVAVAVAVALVLVSIGFLIYFIHHAARSIQVAVILDRVTRLTENRIQRIFPKTIGDPSDTIPTPPPDERSAPVLATTSGYLQAVDGDELFELAECHELLIRMEPHIGDFILEGQVLARVSPSAQFDEEVTARIRRAFALGSDRTPDQDIEFGIIEISDIAVKALSPSVNDPTTAMRCIDRLSQLLLSIGTRYPPDPVQTREGRIHFVARTLTFERVVGLSFDQIRHFAADNPSVTKKLIDTLAILERLVPAERAEPLRQQRERALDAARASIRDRSELAEVERVASQPHPRRDRA